MATRLRKLTFVMLIILSIDIIFTHIAFAESKDYVLDGTKRVPIPVTYNLREVINNVKTKDGDRIYFEGAEDIFRNSQGYFFIADTGNSRIIKMSSNGELVDIFKDGGDKPLKNPKGVFADDDGNMYIADTGNQRIVHLSANGEFIEEFTKPDSSLLGKDFTFEPSKIAISPTGYIYVIRGQSIMIMDAYNRFRGYLGQSDIGFNFIDVLLRKFATEEQKRAVIKRTAAVYTNFTLGEDGMIYATTLDHAEGEIKKLNSIGNNIYRKYSRADRKKISDIFTKTTMTSKPFVYGERADDDGNPIRPHFIDLAVDKDGIVTALEQNTGKIYQYDQEANLLAVFGGKSDQKGKFDVPTSIEVDDDGNIYVLDRALNNIQVFEPTRFIKLVHEAVNLYSNGYYDNAYEVWSEVLKIDDNYPLAHVGMAQALYKQGKWYESMSEYELADDRAGYSLAYTKYRHEVFRENFTLVSLCIILGFVGLFLLIKGLNHVSGKALHEFRVSKPGRMRTSTMIQFSLATIFHPIETFEYVKRDRDRLNYIPTILIMFMLVVVRMMYIYTVHYPLADIDPTEANVFLEIVRMLVPILTWVIASFAITAILDGEARMNEILVASSFCMLPYILVNIPLPLFSQVLSRDESTFYAVIINLTRIWILILIFISVKSMNDYTMGKCIGVCLLSCFTMALIWAVILLGMVLVVQFYEFIVGLIKEIKMIFI